MKKIAIVVLMLLLALIPALAETNAPAPEADAVSYQLTGTVAEITEEGLLIDTADMGQVMALTVEDTIFDTTRHIQPGDYVYIDYDGQMTRSLPAQITAQVVRMYMLYGQITETIPEENAVMLETVSHGPVYAVLPPEWQDAEIDAETMIIYFDGVMTMSLPPHIGAGHALPGYVLEGTVSEVTEDGFLLGEGQEAVSVHYAGEMPAAGDSVAVLYNGMMSRSLPAQISALDVTVQVIEN